MPPLLVLPQPLRLAEPVILTVSGSVINPGADVTYSKQLQEKSALKTKRKRKSTKADGGGAAQPRADDEDSRPKDPLELARELGISSDDTRPGKQRETTLFGKRLIIGGKLSGDVRARVDYGAKDDDVSFAPEAVLEAVWLPSKTTVVFASAKATGEAELYKQGGGAHSKADVELNAFWLLQTRLGGTPLAVQIGRQKMQDRRNWWWDDDIDAVRLHYFGSKVTGFVGIGAVNSVYLSTLGRVEPEERGLLRMFGTAEWEWSKRHSITVFALRQNDRTSRYALGEQVSRDDADRQDAKLSWIGTRARGCFKPKLPRRICYWGDIAQVRGSEVSYGFGRDRAQNSIVNRLTNRDVRGWAYDLGTSIELPFTLKPYLTLGYARGSGDPAGTSGLDGAFRQTGLHKNDGKFRGLTRFRYYGEVLRPNLSNIAVATAAIGVPIGKHSWVETIWHRYRQRVPDNNISGSKLNHDPNGVDKRLGEEVDVIVSHRPVSGWVFELTGGAFRAGPAFGSDAGRLAGLIELKVDYNF